MENQNSKNPKKPVEPIDEAGTKKMIEDIQTIFQPYFTHQLKGFIERRKLRKGYFDGSYKNICRPYFVDLEDPKFFRKFLKNLWFGIEDTYFGIIPRLDKGDGKGRSCKNSFTPYLIIDVDCKDKEVVPSFRNFVSNLQDLKPTLLVFSGRGFHLYFQLKQPLPARLFGETQKNLIQRFQQLLENSNLDNSKLQVDTKITDMPRILRLPGTKNTRSDKICEIVEKFDVVYEVKELIGDNCSEDIEKQIQKIYKKAAKKTNKETTESELSKKLNEYYQQRYSKPIDRYNHYYLDFRNLRTFFNSLKDLLLPHYVPGNRHMIMIYVAGICARLNIYQELCEKFYLNHFSDKDDDEVDDRLKVIKDTYEQLKNDKKAKIRSFALLEALNFNPEEFGLQVTEMVKYGDKFIPLKRLKKETFRDEVMEFIYEKYSKCEEENAGVNNEEIDYNDSNIEVVNPITKKHI